MNNDAISPAYTTLAQSERLQRPEPIPGALYQVWCHDCRKLLHSKLPPPLPEQGVTTYYLCSDCLNDRTATYA